MTNTFNLNLKKRIVITGMLIIATAALLFLLVPELSAVSSDKNSLEEIVSEAPAEVIGETTAVNVYSILGINETSITTLNKFSSNISKAISSIAACIMIALTIYAVLKEIYNGKMELDMWLRVLVKFAIGVAVIIFTDNICEGLQQGGEKLVEIISQAVNSFSVKTIDSNMRDGDILIGIMAIFINLYIKIVGFTLIIELGIRRAFAPLATLSIVTRGMRSPAIRYLKKYLVIYIKMGLMVFVMKLGAVIMGTMDAGTELLAMFCIISASISFIGKGSTIADQIMGTQ